MDTLLYLEELAFIRPDNRFKAQLCLSSRTTPYEDADALSVLHEQELAYYRKLQYIRKHSFMLGRYCAKQAISAYTRMAEPQLGQLWVQQGVFQQPVIMLPRTEPLQITITHCDHIAAAIAFPEAHPVGIDLEKIDGANVSAIESRMTANEKQMIADTSLDYEAALTMLWTSKESLSKILKTGLMTPLSVYEIDHMDIKQDCMVTSYTNFAQYSSVSFRVGRYMCSITHPKRTEFKVNIPEIQQLFGTSSAVDVQ
ncbi:4'-phosphopantetheinyl transferase superfamily protein [Paenibacillus sp. MZ04-78.2]|uniref:4'-phosphopantetheinyl transferase family protein n=1 Tax=Paenibacillus sp. MZ04-78.2 TaxID=2962034 RepID=UPI0020B8F258|nr:4'-phosphopantetheinyl transferase superfamily protein [Paenibacillus sp. MZ04-78.2]MCP3773851.1 4'-phosphopantetheinyl transferase superfamily protein [Paenibacillus sp. MZ04-78.2]